MLRHLSAICLFMLLTSPVIAVDVPAGDIAALRQAILDANERPTDQETIIRTGGEFSFPFGVVLPHIKGSITINGSSYTVFRGDIPAGPEELRVEPLFYIEAGASLRLTSIELTDFRLSHEGEGLIENKGELYLKKVQLSSVFGTNVCVTGKICHFAKPVIINHTSGYLHWDKVSIIDSGTVLFNFGGGGGLLRNEGSAVMKNVQIYLPNRLMGWDTPLRNSGELKVHNSSFMNFEPDGSPSRKPQLLFTSSDEANTEFVNSVIAGFSGEWCQEAASIGHNLIDATGCNWSAEGDLVGVPTGLIWRTVRSPVGPFFFMHALVPSAASTAVDSADADLCTSFDLLGKRRNINDGNGDGVNGCDRGAVELLPIGLAEGGINGLYFNPEADGHFINILQTDFTTLVIWNTFDADGNLAWVFGTGELISGRSIIADAYINRNEGHSPDGDITASEAEPWGRIEVDMTSCLEGTFTFQSDLPEFGSGQFSIKRLAFVKQLGCIDTD